MLLDTFFKAVAILSKATSLFLRNFRQLAISYFKHALPISPYQIYTVPTLIFFLLLDSLVSSQNIVLEVEILQRAIFQVDARCTVY